MSTSPTNTADERMRGANGFRLARIVCPMDWLPPSVIRFASQFLSAKRSEPATVVPATEAPRAWFFVARMRPSSQTAAIAAATMAGARQSDAARSMPEDHDLRLESSVKRLPRARTTIRARAAAAHAIAGANA